MKVEGTVTLKMRVTAECAPGDSLQAIKVSIVKKADEYVKTNGIKPVVTDILVRSFEDPESLQVNEIEKPVPTPITTAQETPAEE